MYAQDDSKASVRFGNLGTSASASASVGLRVIHKIVSLYRKTETAESGEQGQGEAPKKKSEGDFWKGYAKVYRRANQDVGGQGRLMMSKLWGNLVRELGYLTNSKVCLSFRSVNQLSKEDYRARKSDLRRYLASFMGTRVGRGRLRIHRRRGQNVSARASASANAKIKE